jgi:hypothetical protein
MKLRTRVYDSPESENYRIAPVESPQAVTLDKPTLIWCMGGFQTDDVIPRTPEEVKAWLNSGSIPKVREWIHFMSPGATMDAVVHHMGEGIEKMSGVYFHLADQIYRDVPRLRPYVRDMQVVSYRSINELFERRQKLHADINGYYSDEGLDFVRRVIAPAIGEFKLRQDDAGRAYLKFTKRKPVSEAVAHLENLFLVSTSSGGEFIVDGTNALRHSLRASGVPESQQYDLVEAYRAAGVGNIFPVEQWRGPQPRSMVIEGFRDLVAEAVNPYKVPITAGQIDRHAPKEFRQKLIDAAQAYYMMAEDVLNDWGSMTPEAKPDIFDEAPFFLCQKLSPTAMRLVTDVPKHRKRWSVKKDAELSDMLRMVSNDGNGHNQAFLFIQGDPPHHLPMLTRRMMVAGLGYPLLSAREKAAWTVEDFLKPSPLAPKDPKRYLVDELVKEALSRVEYLSADVKKPRMERAS